MKRFFWFRLGFILSALLYSALKIFKVEFVDSIIALVYFLSAFSFVFSAENLPHEHLNIPSVHKYYKSRINYYGLGISIILGISSLSFAIVLVNTQFPVGIICLIFWALMITFVHGYLYFGFNKKQELSSLTNYIEQKTKKKNIKNLVAELLDQDIKNATELRKHYSENSKFKSLSYNDLEQVFKFYLEYINSEELISDEVSEV